MRVFRLFFFDKTEKIFTKTHKNKHYREEKLFYRNKYWTNRDYGYQGMYTYTGIHSLGVSKEIEFYLPRESPEFVNYKETTWGKWLNNPKLEDPHSKLSKLFQLRFRVPFILFKHFLVPRCIELQIFQQERSHSNRCPIEIKIMACLRYLGRGLTYDDIYEMSEIPISSFSVFFS